MYIKTFFNGQRKDLLIHMTFFLFIKFFIFFNGVIIAENISLPSDKASF